MKLTFFIFLLLIMTAGREKILAYDFFTDGDRTKIEFEIHTYCLPDTSFLCQLNIQDTCVNGICLENAQSTIKVVGEKYKFYNMGEDSLIGFPHACFNSADNKQTLVLVFAPGGTRHAYSEFIIRYNTDNSKNKTINTKEFVSSRNISLGKTKIEIIKVFGNCYKTEKVDNHIENIHYYLDDYSNSSFLKRYNLPAYHADFEFTDGKLTKYYFGFVYP